ncbi:MAG TPA: class I SAM-dependent methyltransferase [Bacteroidia bacterium]|nr:class I SAM-dependent methyltransferase [Bacteroidia bacterium]
MNCRFCNHPLKSVFADLGTAPASNSFLSKEDLSGPEVYYPLKVYVCDSCFLVQVAEYKKADEIFDKNYVYFSSYSSSWLEHAKKYVHNIHKRFGYSSDSLVIEIASNDGYLLQYFKELKIPVLGIEPTFSTAEVARSKGIESRGEFFGVSVAKKLVRENKQADLLIGNNVLAHVPDLHDFVGGLKIALKPNGIVTMEFPHLLQLVKHHQFDTIYQEHFSYLSFMTVNAIFRHHGLELFDVEELGTHGGSIRIYAKHSGNNTHTLTDNVAQMLSKEEAEGMNQLPFYLHLQKSANEIKYSLLEFLLDQKKKGAKICAYGAAAKGNTLLNYCGIRADMISFVVDASPHKQGKYLPGSRIPVMEKKIIQDVKPDFILILPWNIKDEIMDELRFVRDWNAKFVIAIPSLTIL